MKQREIVFLGASALLGLLGWKYLDSLPLMSVQSGRTILSSSTPSFSEGGLTALPIPSGQSVDEPIEKVSLGLALFRDNRLSRDNTISCSSCHDLSAYGGDHQAFSFGVGNQMGDVNTPTVFNAVFNFRQFWDGRAVSLGDQIDGPIHNPKEMATDWPQICIKLNVDPSTRSRFQAIYGHEATAQSVIDAVTTFEATLVTLNSPFDRYLRGEKSALSLEQVNGFKKFQNYGCVACHQGVNIGGNMFQTLGVMGDYFADRGGTFVSDQGRFAVTGQEQDRHVFRVPSLRNVAETAPYFHDGQVKTLDQAVRLMGRYQLGRHLSQQDVSELVSFLKSLTGERPTSLAYIQPDRR